VEAFPVKIIKAATLLLVLLTCPLYGDEPAQLTAEQSKVLGSARASALQYRRELPDFICTQITRRFTASKSMGAFTAGIATRNPAAVPGGPDSSSDVIVEHLTYVGKKENYEVVSVDGRKVKNMTHMDIQGGVITGGEFGSVLAQIFEPSSQTNFTWDREAELHGRHVFVYEYHVPRRAGTTVTDAKTHNVTVVPFSGQVSIDPQTLKVLEITSRHDMPPGFPIQVIERKIEYAPQEIAGQVYSLPSRSEIHMEDGARVYENKIEFKDYHHFASDSTIRPVEVAPE
jgi:hypothetical protein